MRAQRWASSPRVRTFAVVFSLTAMVLYVLCLLIGLALFTYHPATGRLEWGQTMPRRGEGPVMYWYGWVLTTLIGGAVTGLVAAYLPDSVSRRIPLAALWILPLLAIPIFAYTLLSFWSK